MTVGIVSDLVPIHWSRGRSRDYVARLTAGGRSVECEWINDRKKSASGTYGAPVTVPGVYELRIKGARSWSVFRPNRTPMWADVPDVRNLAHRLTRDELAAVLEHLVTSAVPFGDSCAMCTSDVEYFTEEGWPTCETHRSRFTDPVVSIDSDCEVPF